MGSCYKLSYEKLVDNNIDFTLVYRDISIKEEYIHRYIDRNIPESFIKMLSKNWETWINELKEQEHCSKIKIKEGEYLLSIF